MKITEKAYAKINLHLEVLNKRDDGFHNILSLMARIDLHDLLKLESIEVNKSSNEPNSIMIKSNGGEFERIINLLPVEENLISRAAEAYLNRINQTARVTFSIENVTLAV